MNASSAEVVHDDGAILPGGDAEALVVGPHIVASHEEHRAGEGYRTAEEAHPTIVHGLALAATNLLLAAPRSHILIRAGDVGERLRRTGTHGACTITFSDSHNEQLV